MRRTAFLTAFLAFFSALFAQKTPQKGQAAHQLVPNFEYLTCVGIGLVGGGSQIAAHGLKPFSESQILAFGAPARPTFAERHFSADARFASDALAVLSGAAAVGVCFRQANGQREQFTNLVMLGEAASLTYFLTETSKNWARQPRPFVFNPKVVASKKLELDARRSFFSGHASMAATAAFFSAKVWTDRHPDSPKIPLVWAGAAGASAAVGFLRMAAGKHYFRDVSTGFFVGALVGWAVPETHRRLFRRKERPRPIF